MNGFTFKPVQIESSNTKMLKNHVFNNWDELEVAYLLLTVPENESNSDQRNRVNDARAKAESTYAWETSEYLYWRGFYPIYRWQYELKLKEYETKPR